MTNTAAYRAVLKVELEHLKRGRHGLIIRCYLSFMVLIALSSFAWRIIDTIPQQPSLFYWLLTELHFDTTNYFAQGGINDAFKPLMLVFPIGVVVWDLWLMVRTLTMSTQIITREHDEKDWNLPLLTGVTPYQIVRAKWSAVINQQWRDYVLLAIMRIGAVSFVALNFSVNFLFGQFPYFSYGSNGPHVEPDRTLVYLTAVSIVLLSAALLGVLTMLNLMFTAACGLVGGQFTRRSSLKVASGIWIRFLLPVVFAIVIGIPSYLVLKPDIELNNYYPNPIISTIFLILSLVGATVIDTGSIAAGLLMRFGYNYRWATEFYGFVFFSYTLRGHGPAFLTALTMSIGIYGIATYRLLWRAEKIITQTAGDR